LAIEGESAKHRNLDTAGMDEGKVIADHPDTHRQAWEGSYGFDESAKLMRARR
jgi:hypothetical protein